MRSDGHVPVQEIATLVSRSPDVEELEHALVMVRENGRSIIELLRSSLEHLPEISARSYRHPNGFAKIVLHDGGPQGTSIRLHVWPAVENASPEDLASRRDSAPHGHRWNFASTVIAGSGLFVEEFEVQHLDEGEVVDPSEVVWDELVFQPSVTSIPRRLGAALLRCREYWIRDPVRDIYWCDVLDVHTIGPIDGGMTATLVLQGPEVRATAPVFRRPDGPPDPGRRPLDEASVAGLIHDVLRHIDRDQPDTAAPAMGSPSAFSSTATGPPTGELEIVALPRP